MITVGRYQLVEKLGQGGMGVVYRAFDTLLQRVVAVKIILGMIEPGSEQRERFFREARAAGQLSHRNIITIHDLGEHEGQPYLAMEYLEGEDLQRRLSRPVPLSLAQKMELAIQVSEGLEYAHARGIVHRDVKPANIFITNDGTAKILDFGLARLMTSELTHSKFMMGTINYMAPEQVMGERADHRADIFAFGVVLYELLGGRKAFDGDSAAATLYKIVEANPEPLPQIDPAIPAELVAVVDRALAKPRDQRYQQMSEVLADLVVCRQQTVGPDSPAAGKPGSGGSLRVPMSARTLQGAAGPSTPLPGNSTDETALVPDVSPPPGSGRSATPPAAPPGSARARLVLAAVVVLIALAGLAGWLWRAPGAPPAPPVTGVTNDQSRAPAAAALALAVEALDAGRPEDAQRHVQAALAADPDDAEARRMQDRIATMLASVDRTLREAQEHFDGGRYAEASRAAGTVLGQWPAHPGAQQLMEDATSRLEGRGADEARRRMAQAKAAARAASAATLAPAAYNAALGTEQGAQRAFDAGELDTATARFYEASGLFRSAEVSAQSEAAARADRAQAARVERERLDKERAERERADQEQRDRERAERERLASQAATTPKPEPVRPPPPPPAAAKPPAPDPPARTAPPEPSAEALITDLLAQYEAAFEARSLGALQRLWPTLAGAQEAAIRSEFEHASRIDVGITSPRIEVVGGTATATFIREYDLVTIDGQRLSSRSLTTISCRRTAAGWVIEQVRYEPVR